MSTFLVYSNHNYAEPGVYDIKLIIAARDGDATVADGEVTIEPPNASLTGQSITVSGINGAATVGEPFSGTIATFTDSDLGDQASDWTATLDGDGTLTVTGSDGHFVVSAALTFSSPGNYTLLFDLDRDGTEGGYDSSFEVSSIQVDGPPSGGASSPPTWGADRNPAPPYAPITHPRQTSIQSTHISAMRRPSMSHFPASRRRTGPRWRRLRTRPITA